MLNLILIGLLGSVVSATKLFWGFYVAAWIIWAIKFILEIIVVVYHFRTDNTLDIK